MALSQLPDRATDSREPRVSPPWKPLDGSAPVDSAVPSELDGELLPPQRHFEHAEATKSERDVALALQMQRTGSLLLQRMQGVLQAPSNDEAAMAETLGNLQCLIRVNPDRETLAGLMSAACKAIDMGVTLEKRALAMVKVADPVEVYDSGSIKQAAACNRTNRSGTNEQIWRFYDKQ